MLSPHERTALFAALRPPPGYRLDHAVGTSFTLDLEALLTAPIAFALFEARDADPDQQDVEPVGLLEAIRRHAQRITVFCQAGQVAVPQRHRVVFAWLEEAVREIRPPRPHRLFHPKVWLVRYESATEEQRILRVLCPTRNLTLDTSWDTLLCVESAPYETRPTTDVPGQQALADLFHRLPTMATLGVRDATRRVADLAADLRTVPLVPPEPFTSLWFHVLGLDETEPFTFPSDATRALVVSPFLSEPFLATFTADHEVAALISREESLDRVGPGGLGRIDRLAVLNSAAGIDPSRDHSSPVSNGGPRAPDEDSDPGNLFGGLHAKLFVFDTPAGSRVFTGSANATEAAFGGNVEVLAELSGAPEVGVAGLLAETPGETGFDDILVDYDPLPTAVEESEGDRLERDMGELRRQMAGHLLRAAVSQDGDHYRLDVDSRDSTPQLPHAELELTIRPITLLEDQAAVPLTPGRALRARFTVTLEGISAFFAVRATGRRGGESATTTFLVTADLEGAPDDRHGRLLAAVLRDPARLLRYLLLLLSDTDALPGEDVDETAAAFVGRWEGRGWDEVPLLELLVRATHRFPDRLDHIHQLLTDLGDSADQVVPAGFYDLWRPIWQSYQETAS